MLFYCCNNALFSVLIMAGPNQASDVFNGSTITMNKPVLELEFSRFIDPKTVNSSTITFTDSMGNAITNIMISAESTQAILSLPQLGPENYTLNVSGVKDSTDTSILTGYTMSLKAVIPYSSSGIRRDYSDCSWWYSCAGIEV